jgi:predicted MPP superfamily phosphohydrolase
MAVALLLLALLGHAAIWVALANRIDGLVIRRALCKVLTRLAMFCAAAIPVAFAAGVAGPAPRLHWAGTAYVAACWLMGALTIVAWLSRRLFQPGRVTPRSQRSTYCDLRSTVAAVGAGQLLTRFPGNGAFELEVNELELTLPRLPSTLDGLRIAQLSDLHFSASVGKAYFQAVVQRCNQLSPDLVVLTGDLTEGDEQVAWIPDTLGRLTSRYGVYFVLGNHDILINTGRLCRVLSDAGLRHLDGRCVQLDVRGRRVILAGRELPWFRPTTDAQALPPRRASDGLFVIALTHTPDQLPWARAQGVDLLLAGHTHGGQICPPLIGPIIVPSRWGVKYAAGAFHTPPTLMYVSRGISGKYPIRVNCPPELTCLVLRSIPAAG